MSTPTTIESDTRALVPRSESSRNHQVQTYQTTPFTWSGKFQSSMVGMVHGTMWVPLRVWMTLRHGALSNLKFDTTATLRYDGLYRWNQSSNIPVKVSLSVDENQRIRSSGRTAQWSPIMSFKVGTVSGIQGITYTVTNFTETQISGVYETVGPNDRGTFTLAPTNELAPDNPSMCVIV